ncbi:MAG: DUF3810 domain-containing protein [Lachnospiraceae bacterium]|jgi:hypothetical protein|nr:DUF3810 domain-containing protein [Lachnospiraceae bacterium]
MNRDSSRKQTRLLLGAGGVFLGLGAGLLAAARRAEGFAAWYADVVYPVLVGSIGWFFGLFPVSAAEIFLYLLLAGLLLTAARLWRHPHLLASVLFFGASFLLFLYAAGCGVNYYRRPFSSYYLEGADRETAGDEDLRALCAWLTEQVGEARKELSGETAPYEKLREKGVAAMEALAEEYPVLGGFYPKPKPVLVSRILSVQQCSGIYSPFTIEANYNRDMVPYNIPHTICHELSHLRGFMREDEANFIAYLACLNAADAEFRYSGCLLGWIYAGNALARFDWEEYRRLYGELPEETRAELAENSRFWARYEGRTAEIANQVNDAYLKANGQAEGIKTYGRVVDLMLVDFRNRN